MLETPEKIRELQRKLYLKGKQEKTYRFYLLYDKVYRQDILDHAYRLVRANKGAAGVDGVTFKDLESREGGVKKYLEGIAEELKAKTYKPMAVKIVIEPIFEADFQENAYGFRPKRNAHQAMEDIKLHLRTGKVQVIDADISKYFDTIAHDKLLKLISERIVDKNILKIIRIWLQAPVVEEDEEGKKRYQKNDRGTPQGGVISALLANRYLNVLDRIWKAKKVQERMRARLIRYADDFVVLCQGQTGRLVEGIKKVLGEIGLEMNESKTRVVDAREESFNFLGFTVRVVKHRQTGREFSLIRPSQKALTRIKGEIKQRTGRNTLALPQAVVLGKLNEIIRGWIGYFYYGNCSRDLYRLKRFTEQRLRIYLRRKHRGKNWGYKAYPDEYIYETLGLYRIPTKAPWKITAKA